MGKHNGHKKGTVYTNKVFHHLLLTRLTLFVQLKLIFAILNKITSYVAYTTDIQS